MLKYLEAQRHLLSDPLRIAAYQAALEAVVQPGDVVIDLGAGSGILGWLALRAGAARVIAVDDSPNVHIVRELARRHGLSDRLDVRPVHSTRLHVDQAADVIVCDQAGPLGWEGGLVEVLHDARVRLLRPGGRIIPAEIETLIAPSDRPAVSASLRSWQTPVSGLDVSFLEGWASNDLWAIDPGDEGGPHAEPLPAGRWRLGEDNGRAPKVAELSWRLARSGIVSGFEGWFRLMLSEGNIITNGPEARAVRRARRFLPLHPPLDARAGDDLKLRLLTRPSGRLVQWSGTLERDGAVAATFSADNFGALLRERRPAIR